jgi:hypothetical protein
MQMTNEDKFFEWWNGDEMADDLDVVKHTPLYWAMQGWEAANRQPWVKTYSGGKPNYTEPKEWVGLTNEEYEAMAEQHVTNCYFDTLKYAKAIEAKLKEKNA